MSTIQDLRAPFLSDGFHMDKRSDQNGAVRIYNKSGRHMDFLTNNTNQMRLHGYTGSQTPNLTVASHNYINSRTSGYVPAHLDINYYGATGQTGSESWKNLWTLTAPLGRPAGPTTSTAGNYGGIAYGSSARYVYAQYGNLAQYNNNWHGHNTRISGGIGVRIEYNILAKGFYVSSDERTKTNIQDMDCSASLAIVRSLKPTYYNHIDDISEPDELNAGFVAQDVYDILPQATVVCEDYVPNIFKVCSVQHDISDTCLLTIPEFDASTLEKDASDNIFSKIRLIDPSNNEFTNVFLREIVDSNSDGGSSTIRISCEDHLTSEVFVYGQYVKNFLTVNHEQIFTTGISALQGLHKEYEEENAKIESLEAKLADLMTRSNYVG